MVQQFLDTSPRSLATTRRLLARLLPSLLLALALPACGGDGGDDTPPDAATPDAAPDPEPNPFGISFTEVTYQVVADGVLGGRNADNILGVGSGAAAADVDGDGKLDLFFARCDGGTVEGGPSMLLRQGDPGSEFPGFTSDPLMEVQFTGVCAHGVSFGDYDLDGDPDLFVAMTGADRLYRNDGGTTFTDVTAAAGVAGPDGDVNTSAYWADVNHDGLLDLFVPAHVPFAPPEPSDLNANRLYINQGDGTFASVGGAAGIEGNGSSQSAAISDLDGDGDLEIYVANDRFAVDGQLREEVGLEPDAWLDLTDYDAQGIPSYTNRAAQYGVTGPRSSMGIAIADVDGDGNDDMFVSDFGANHLQIWNPITEVYDDKAVELATELREAPLLGFLVSWDAVFSDLDHDGQLELMIIHGSVTSPRSCGDFTQFDYFLRWEPTRSAFRDITSTIGFPFDDACPPQDDRPLSGRGLVLADLDGDHDDDLIVTPFVERYRVYRNDTPQTDRHFLRVVPRGTVSAPFPYGAVLEVVREDGSSLRRTLYAGGTTTQRFPLLQAGLDSATTIQSATLHWPSGYRQRLDMSPDFVIDTTWTITEPEWLTLSTRVADSSGDAPTLTYTPVDDAGVPLGAAGAGRDVKFTRSDDQLTSDMIDNNDGTYTALLPHPGAARITVVQVVDNGTTLRPRLTVNYK